MSSTSWAKAGTPSPRSTCTFSATRADERPRIGFFRIKLHFTMRGNVPAAAVERAIALSREKYCSVSNSLRQDIEFTTTFEVSPDDSVAAIAVRAAVSRLAARRRRRSRWSSRTSSIRGRATADRHDETLLHAALHWRRRVAAVPVSGRRRDSACRRRRRGGRRAAIAAGARAARRRGWEIFVLGLFFRLQAQAARLRAARRRCSRSTCSTSWACRWSPRRICGRSLANGRCEPRSFAVATTAARRMLTPLVRAAPGWRRCPIRSRPTCGRPGAYSAFPLFPWAGFLFARRARRRSHRRRSPPRGAFGASRELVCRRRCSCAERSGSRSRGWPRFSRRSIPPHASGTIRRRSSSSGFGFVTALVSVAWLVERAAERVGALQRSSSGRW